MRKDICIVQQKKEGVGFKTINLYIGGCPLKTHYINCLENNDAYYFEFNGESTPLKTTIKQALICEDWDVVTLQQASHYSAKIETYSPYIEYLTEYVKKYCPHAKFIFIKHGRMKMVARG